MKDFAKSYSQFSWASAVEAHTRLQNWLTSPVESMRNYAEKRIHDLEKEYPQLKK